MKIRSKSVRIFLFIFSALLVGAMFIALISYFTKPVDAAWVNDSWKFRKKLVIDASQVSDTGSADYSNFPVLVSIDNDASLMNSAQTDGDDILFTSSDGTTQLDHEIESYDSTKGTLRAWVEVTTLDYNNDTTIYIYYGNPSASSQQNATGTWNSNYAGVWHLSEASGNVSDSTSNNNDSTSANGLPNYGQTGKIDKAINFNSSTNDYFDMGNKSSLLLGTNPFTLGAWVKTSQSASYIGIFGKMDGSGTSGYIMETHLSRLRAWLNNTPYDSINNINDGSWKHVVIVRDDSNQIRLYIDGSQDANPGTSSANVDDTGNFNIGRWHGGTEYDYNGLLDEVRVSNTNRSAGWIATEYANQNSPSTFFKSVGKEEKSKEPVLFLKFDEGTGTVANDSSSQRNNGTLSGTTKPAWQSEDLCVFGKCLYFEGSTAYVGVGSTSPNVNTVSFWVKPKTNGEPLALLDGGTHNIAASGGVISANGFGSPLIYVNGKRSTTLTANSWQYVEVTTATAFSSASMKVGTNGTTYLNGFIDEFKVYDYVRSPTQVLADYNARGSPKGAGAVLGAKQTEFLSEGLVGYWKMDESSWNGTSNEAVDSSGNGNHGQSTCWGTCSVPSTAAAKFGNGGSFDGTDDYLTVADSDSLDILTDMTISLWFKADTLPGYGEFVKKNVNYVLRLSSDSSKYEFDWWNGTQLQILATGTTSTGAWRHLVGVVKNNSIDNVYVDGVALGGTPTVSNAERGLSIPLYIGGTADNGEKFDGLIDELRIYKRALSPKEIRDLYVWAPGPVGYWKLDEKSGTTAYNTGSNTDNGTLNSAQWTNGKFGSAVSFPASANGENITVSNAQNYLNSTSSSFTISTYIKLLNSTAPFYWYNASAVTRGATTGNGGCSTSAGIIREFRSATSARIYFNLPHQNSANCNDSTNAGYTESTNLTFQRWYYTTATYEASTKLMSFYLDGVLIGTATWGGSGDWTWANSNLIFNNSNSGATTPGIALDEVKIYNYARTAKQIVEDMNAGHPAVGSPVGSAVGYWDLDEGQGTTAHDLSINRNDLTLSAASWTKAGKFGMAYTGASNTRLTRADDADFDFAAADDLTLSVWFKRDTISNQEYLVYKENGNEGYALSLDSDGDLVFGIGDTGSTSFPEETLSTDSKNYDDNNWHHAVAIKQGTTALRLYVDGKEVTSDTSVAVDATLENAGKLIIGDANETDGTDEFLGTIDELKIYRYALTEDEVKTEFNQGKSIVLGALGSNPSYPSNSSNQEYCVPGDSTSCAAPVGEWKFEEKTGTSANDTSGNGNTGTWNGTGSHWTNGKYGGAGNFNGSSDYISSTVSTVNTTAGGYNTVSYWMNWNGTYGSNGPVPFTFYSGSVYYGIYFLNNCMGFNTGNSDIYGINPNALANKWVHVALVMYNGAYTNNNKMYINGVQQTLTQCYGSAQSGTMNTSLSIGRLPSSYYFPGSIDEFKVFNYARTPAQIAWDYNKGKPIAYWDFDECTGSSVYDSSGNGNTGTINLSTTGTQTTAIGNGTCTTNASTPWYNGRTGKRNYSLNFDGTDDYVSVTDSNSLDMAGDFSLSTWVNLSSTPSNEATVITKRIDNSYEYWMAINTSRQPYGAFGAMADTVTSDNALLTGQWYHLVVVLNTTDNNLKLYVNGKLDKTASANSRSPSAGTNNVGIGGFVFYGAPSFVFPGQIDDVKVFNYPLTATQVKNEYNQGAVRFGPLTGSP